MLLINCEINCVLTSLENCTISEGNRGTNVAIAVTKLYALVAILSTQNNTKLLQQLKLGSKCTINSNKYPSKVTAQARNQYLDYLTDPNFQRVNRLFVLAFQEKSHQIRRTGYFLPKVDIKINVIMIQCYDRWKKHFDQTIKNALRTYTI